LIYDRDLIMKLKKVTYLPFPWKRERIHPVYRGTLVQALIGAMKYGKSDIYPVADEKPVLLTEFFKEIARPRPMLWMPPQVIWLGIAAAYPLEWIAKLTRTRPIVTPSFIRSLFEERVLDTGKAERRLKYSPVDTLETIGKLIHGARV
jgi:nucleoside-diphosphate-sugar epimerase